MGFVQGERKGRECPAKGSAWAEGQGQGEGAGCTRGTRTGGWDDGPVEGGEEDVAGSCRSDKGEVGEREQERPGALPRGQWVSASEWEEGL